MDNENFEQNVTDEKTTDEQNAAEIQNDETKVKPKKDWKKIIKDILYYACIAAIVCILIYMYIGSYPMKSENLTCKYSDKQDKITCVQMGDVVPEWMNLNQMNLVGSNNPFSMNLIFSKGSNNYISMKMVDSVFVTGLNRKLIYELENQSLKDYIRFKNFVKSSEMSNFGSVALYCSDNNLTENVCKSMKRNYRK